MAVNETIENGFYRIRNSANTGWRRIALWTKTSQVERANGANLEDELEMTYLRANKNVYISPTGSDTTGNGSSENPYKTFAKALSVCPKNLNGFSLTLHVYGGTYTEEVVVSGFGGGRVSITARDNIVLNGSLYILDCDSSVQIQSLTGNTYSFTINNTANTNGAIALSNNKFVNFVRIPLIITSNSNGIYAYGGTDSYFSKSVTLNNCQVAIMANQGSRMSFSEHLTGSGNVIGIRAFSGTISYDKTLFTLAATSLAVDIHDGSIITNDLASQSQITALDAKIGSKVIVSAAAPADTSAVWVY